MAQTIEEIQKQIALRIRTRRLELGLSQKELGKLYGVTPVAITRYEAGQRRLGANDIARMAAILEVSINYFYEDWENGEITPRLAYVAHTARMAEARLNEATKALEEARKALDRVHVDIEAEQFTRKDREILKALNELSEGEKDVLLAQLLARQGAIIKQARVTKKEG
jgi:transcriptional regulator with XRE-family HTH domain